VTGGKGILGMFGLGGGKAGGGARGVRGGTEPRPRARDKDK
jgi:hypothetical protein